MAVSVDALPPLVRLQNRILVGIFINYFLYKLALCIEH
jgi:hypothetical protein